MSYNDLIKGLTKATKQHRSRAKIASVDQDVSRSKPLACFSKLLPNGRTLVLYLSLQEDVFIVRESEYGENNLTKSVKPDFKFLTLPEARHFYTKLIKNEVN